MTNHAIYTTYGPVRGFCGHHHRSPEAAQRCVARDARTCRRAGGYTDRRVIDERAAYSWATESQGFDGSYHDWLALPPTVRAEYETGAQGIGTT